MPDLWQIAAGTQGRNYSRLFLDHDIMVMGPGTPGPAKGDRYSGEAPMHIYSQIRSFYRNPEPGDGVLLRIGGEVIALGKIPDPQEGTYEWNQDFDDVLGWDLQHTRRVQWETAPLKKAPELGEFFKDRIQTPTFTRVKDKELRLIVSKLLETFSKRSLKSLPVSGAILSNEELGKNLFNEGVSNELIASLLEAISGIQRLSDWYWSDQSHTRPTEHEVVGHCVIPFLRALGWSEQLLAIEWNKIDVAIFDRTPTDHKSCIAICEAKGLGRSLEKAYQQARLYVVNQGLDGCKTIITSDGPRIVTYRRKGDNWPEEPTGYFNCSIPRQEYLFQTQMNGVQTIVGLMASRLGSQSK